MIIAVFSCEERDIIIITLKVCLLSKDVFETLGRFSFSPCSSCFATSVRVMFETSVEVFFLIMLMHAGLIVCFFASFFFPKTTGCCFCVFSFQDVCSSLGRSYLFLNPWPFFFSSCSSLVLLPPCVV